MTLLWRWDYYPQFLDEETETQRVKATSSGHRSSTIAKLTIETKSIRSKTCTTSFYHHHWLSWSTLEPLIITMGAGDRDHKLFCPEKVYYEPKPPMLSQALDADVPPFTWRFYFLLLSRVGFKRHLHCFVCLICLVVFKERVLNFSKTFFFLP